MNKKLESKSPLDATPGSGLTWPRSDPSELEKFDPRTKQCTMNCGQHSDDPRSKKEVLFQCDECDIVTPKNDSGRKVTPPDQLCKWPHMWPCLGHMGVLRGIYPACDICEPHLERSREITGIKKTHEITATLTADKELPASTANALGTMIQLASAQLARGDFHNQNHENTDTISELATDGRVGRDEPQADGGGKAPVHLLVMPVDSQND